MQGQQLLDALDVKIIGEGPVNVVLSHGIGTEQSVWSRMLPYITLVQGFRVIKFDLMCAGSRSPANYDFNRYSSLDAYVDDLLNMLDFLGIRNCAFVGHSLSAMIGMLASIRRPQLFDRLILIGASPRYTNDGDYNGGIDPADMEVIYNSMLSNYESWVQGFVPRALGGDMPEAVQEFSRTLFNMRPDIAVHVTRVAFDVDVRNRLHQVRVPVFILQTAADPSVPRSVAEYMRDHLGGRTWIVLLKHTEGHLPHLSAPSIVGPTIERILRRRID